MDKDAILPILPESEGPAAGGSTETPSLAAMLSGGKDPDPAHTPSKSSSTAVIVEGMPPIASKLLDRIRRWDYVDLVDLLSEPTAKQYDVPSSSHNQVILVQSLEQVRKKKKNISDIETWLQAFSMYAAALVSDPTTSKDESAGLLAHMYLITQIAKDLGGTQWYKYDKEFRERAAATNTRVWGTLNVSIYGRCLVGPQPQASPSSERAGGRFRPPEKRSKTGKQINKACVSHNFESSCSRRAGECYFDHVCWYCGAKEHTAESCPTGPKNRKLRRGEKDSH